ncbi:MAG: TrwC relaxase, partial [Jatrophihabitans sp.]
MTVSIRRLSLGAGYEYLLRSVARGDAAANAASPLTRYYTESGTPPGRFLGAGLAGLADGAGIPVGTVVTEEQLFRMVGMLTDPVTGEPLGRRPSAWPTPRSERVAARVAALGPDLGDEERAGAVARIEQEERQRQVVRPVAGFDLTFSVPKSVSAVWAVAGPETQAEIYQAHQDAIGIAIGWAERNVVFTRSGTSGAVQDDVRGVVATAFDHWDSRTGDPHLHTHVVVVNRAQSVSDGQWRSLDSKTLFRYTVALSELHEGVLEDLLTERLGYGWDERARAHSVVPRHDVAGIPDELIEEFSQRSGQIQTETARLIARWAAQHGRQPSDGQILRLRQQATLATRPDKEQHSLAEQTDRWRVRARPFVGGDTAAWADSLRDRVALPALTADSLDAGLLRDAARIALDAVAHKRSTFNHANVLAEVHRQLHGVRFATVVDRLAVAERMTAAALEQAIRLDPPEPIPAVERLRRPDGTSRLVHRGSEHFTTQTILDAEDRLLAAGRDRGAPGATVPEHTAATLAGTPVQLGPDQVAAVHSIAQSGRVLDVLVGAAGTGKTASLAALRTAWESAHGPGSVIGLAPSAAAAEVLGNELNIDTENTAKWLHEAPRNPERRRRLDTLLDRMHTVSSSGTVLGRRLQADLRETQAELARWSVGVGQLVIIDEAGLAGTLTLDAIVAQVAAAGGKVVLVGDPHQLSAIEAGGAFAMLVNDRDDPPELTEVRRFRHEWERDASRLLRVGDPAAITRYEQHGRIRSGNRDDMLDALYRAWSADTVRGLQSLMLANDS